MSLTQEDILSAAQTPSEREERILARRHSPKVEDRSWPTSSSHLFIIVLLIVALEGGCLGNT